MARNTEKIQNVDSDKSSTNINQIRFGIFMWNLDNESSDFVTWAANASWHNSIVCFSNSSEGEIFHSCLAI